MVPKAGFMQVDREFSAEIPRSSFLSFTAVTYRNIPQFSVRKYRFHAYLATTRTEVFLSHGSGSRVLAYLCHKVVSFRVNAFIIYRTRIYRPTCRGFSWEK